MPHSTRVGTAPEAALRTLSRPLRALATTLVVAATAVVLLIAPAPAHAAGDDTIGLSGAPAADAETTPRTRFSYQIGPGQTVDDAYVVTNRGTTSQTFTVFATDAYNTDDGGYGLLDTGVKPSDAGSWVTFAGGKASVQVALAPSTSATLPFTVTVPADASPGDHAAGVVISALSPDGQVLVDRRVGTRMYVRVPGELQPALTIAGLSSSYEPTLNPLDGTTTITLTVKNAGNVALGANMAIGVKTFFGIGVGDVVKQSLDELLPGATRTFTATVHGTGQWVYLNPYVSLSPTVDPGALNPGPLRATTRDTVLFVVPWVLLALLVIALLVWLWIRFSRRRDARRAEAWMAHAEAEAQRRTDGELVGAGAEGAKDA